MWILFASISLALYSVKQMDKLPSRFCFCCSEQIRLNRSGRLGGCCKLSRLWHYLIDLASWSTDEWRGAWGEGRERRSLRPHETVRSRWLGSLITITADAAFLPATKASFKKSLSFAWFFFLAWILSSGPWESAAVTPTSYQRGSYCL